MRYALIISLEIAYKYAWMVFVVSVIFGMITTPGQSPYWAETPAQGVIASSVVTAVLLFFTLTVAGIFWAESEDSALLAQGLTLGIIYLYAFMHGGFAAAAWPIPLLPQLLHDWWPVVFFVVIGIPLIHLLAELVVRWFRRGEPPEGPSHPMNWR